MAFGKIRNANNLLSSGPEKAMFRMVRMAFKPQPVFSLLDRKLKKAFNSIGALTRRKIRRNLKVGKRYKRISDIPDKDIRKRYHIFHALFMANKINDLPPLPMKPSKPGRYPKIKSLKSPLYLGIGYDYDPHSGILLVGARPFAGTKGIAPMVLEHGGTSNHHRIAKRGYVAKTMFKMISNGTVKRRFSKIVKV